MATDIRESILARLLAIGTTVVGAGKAFRNKIEVPEDKRPAFIVMDGDEAVDDALNQYGRGKPSTAPVIMDLSPEIYLLVQEETDRTGTVLNTWRAALVKAIMTDATLKSLCHELRYEGFTPALALGRSMEGQARLHFTFVYVLRIDQL